MLGEMDCRTGLLRAVDKLQYPDLNAAVACLADIYCQVLQDLLMERSLARVWVAPVPPALNMTRTAVRRLNCAVQAKVRARP